MSTYLGMPRRVRRRPEEVVRTPMAAALLRARRDLELSQPEMAEKLGFTLPKVAALELGRYEPTTDTLLKYGAIARGEAKEAIVEELRKRFAETELVEVVA